MKAQYNPLSPLARKLGRLCTHSLLTTSSVLWVKLNCLVALRYRRKPAISKGQKTGGITQSVPPVVLERQNPHGTKFTFPSHERKVTHVGEDKV